VILAAMAVLLGGIAVWIIHKLVLHIDFNMSTYLMSYGVVTLPSIIFSILICSSLYLITSTMDISFLIFGFMFFISINSSNYLMNWVQPSTPAYSDFGGIEPVLRLIVYNRILWFFLCLSLFAFGLMIRRRYELGIIKSFSINIKMLLLPVICMVTLIASIFLYINQPYIYEKDSALNNDIRIEEGIRLKGIIPHVTFYPKSKSMSANVSYLFEKIKDKGQIDFITNTGLNIKSITVNNKEADFNYLKGTDIVRVQVPKGTNVNIAFKYEGVIKYPTSNSFAGYITDKSIYLLENSHWIFQPLVNTEDSIEVVGSVTAPENLTVVPIGKLTGVTKKDGMKTWKYSMKCQDIDLGVFASEYKQETIQVGNRSVEFYYTPQHESYIKALDIGGNIKNIFEYYEQNIGSYPFDDVPLKIVESSIYKTGGHSTSNIVTVSEYVFNRNNVPINTMIDITFSHDVGLIAHEIAHQWWGLGVSFREQNEWSSEGFAEYFSYKYIQKNFDPFLSEYISSNWRYAVSNQEYSYFIKNPEKMSVLQKNFRKRIEMLTEKTLVYNMMPLQLINMEKLKGEEVFVKKISQVYNDNLFNSLEYEVFLAGVGVRREEISVE
jgi:hypothetical protein